MYQAIGSAVYTLLFEKPGTPYEYIEDFSFLKDILIPTVATIQHYDNPTYIYCRFRDMGVEKERAERWSRKYEAVWKAFIQPHVSDFNNYLYRVRDGYSRTRRKHVEDFSLLEDIFIPAVNKTEQWSHPLKVYSVLRDMGVEKERAERWINEYEPFWQNHLNPHISEFKDRLKGLSKNKKMRQKNHKRAGLPDPKSNHINF